MEIYHLTPNKIIPLFPVTLVCRIGQVGRALSFFYLIFYDKFIRVGRTRGNISLNKYILNHNFTRFTSR